MCRLLREELFLEAVNELILRNIEWVPLTQEQSVCKAFACGIQSPHWRSFRDYLFLVYHARWSLQERICAPMLICGYDRAAPRGVAMSLPNMLPGCWVIMTEGKGLICLYLDSYSSVHR